MKGALRAMRGAHLHQSGQWHEGYSELEAAARSMSGEWTSFTTFANVCMSMVLFDAGQWDRAEQVARQAAGAGLQFGESAVASAAYAAAALIPVLRGQPEGEALFDIVRAGPSQHSAQGGAEHQHAAHWAAEYVNAWRAIVTEQHATAADLLLQINDASAPRIDIVPMVLMGRALYYSGRAEALSTLIRTVDDARVVVREEARQYVIAYVRGLAASDPENKMQQLFVALERLDNMAPQSMPHLIAEGSGFRVQRALLGMDIATVVHENPDILAHRAPEVIDLVAWSATIFAGCGARVLADRATILLDALRENKRSGITHDLVPDHIADVRLDGLTRREREIALLVAEGKTNTEIAQDLFISVRTAEKHVANTLRKLEIHSRVELRRTIRAGTATTRS